MSSLLHSPTPVQRARAAFDAGWSDATALLRSDDNDRRWDAVATLAPGLPVTPVMRTTEAPRRMKEVAALLDDQREYDQADARAETFDAPAGTVQEPRLPLDEWFAVQASYYRSHGTDLGDYCARLWDRQAELSRYTGALTVEDLEARIEILEDDRDAEPRAEGYDQAWERQEYAAGHGHGHGR